MHLTNIFKNIKTLEITDLEFRFEFKYKINLPMLVFLKIKDSSVLHHFSDLKSLRKIFFGFYETIFNIEKVIDPLQIIEISINKVSNEENLCLFTNLRSL